MNADPGFAFVQIYTSESKFVPFYPRENYFAVDLWVQIGTYFCTVQ